MADENKKLKQEYEKWLELQTEYKETHPERRKQYKLDIGHEVKSLYTPLDLEERGFEYEKDLGFPGQAPNVRGITPLMNRGENLVYSVYSGFGTAEDSKERYEKIINWGATKLNMAWDLPSQIGYDSDHIMATGEIGRTGVAIDSLKDLEILFADVKLNEIGSIASLCNSIGPIGAALFAALGKKQGLDPTDFTVYLQNDPLKEYAARGTYIFPIEPAVKLACDTVEWTIKNAPTWGSVQFCGNHFNAAGAGSTNACAFAMSDGFVYIDELIRRGYTPEEIIPHCRMFVDEREDFFVAAALGRAARKVWGEQMESRYGVAPNSTAKQIRMTSYGHGGETLTEPISNVMRIGFAALGYYLGGVQFMSNAGYDEAMGLAKETTCKVSLRTSQIINNELGFSKVIDPLAGSYYVESLTMDIASDIRKEIANIQENYGDSKAAISAGYFQGIISRGAVRRQAEFENLERQFVSVNVHKTDEELPRGAFKIDPSVEARQLARLKQVREERDNEKVQRSLEELRKVTLSGENVVDTVIEALLNYVTIGEICGVWREIYGEYRSLTTF